MLLQSLWPPHDLATVLLTLAITWPQVVLGDEHILAVAAQVYGNVREWQECPAPEAVTLSR